MSTFPPWLDVEKHPLRAAFVLGLLHALLFGLAFPPFGIWPCAFIAAAPVMVIVIRTNCSWRSALGVALGSAPMWAVHHAWTWEVSAAGLPGLVVYLAVWSGLFVVVARVALRAVPSDAPKWIALALVWMGMEHLRGSVVAHGYPWFLIGHPMIAFGPIAMWGSVIGAAGVGFIITLVNAAIGSIFWVRGPKRFGAIALAMVGLGSVMIIGAMELTGAIEGDRQLRVGIVQSNMPQSNKRFATFEERFEAFQVWRHKTRELVEATPRPDFIVWPETMFPGLALDEAALSIERDAQLSYEIESPEGMTRLPSTIFAGVLTQEQQDWDVPMLIGAIGWNDFRLIEVDGVITPQGERFNSVVLLQEGAGKYRYDKVALTPFGEVMPYISAWPWLEKQLLSLGAHGMSFELSAGTDLSPLRIETALGTVSAATPICFESTVTGVCRGMVYANGHRRADVIVNLTNDGWFGDFDGARRHHLWHARWRAIELGVPVVRAANTGISCVIDRQGHVRDAAPAREAAALSAEIVLPGGDGTIYGRAGNVIGPVCAVMTVALAGAGGVMGWRTRKQRAGERMEGGAHGADKAEQA